LDFTKTLRLFGAEFFLILDMLIPHGFPNETAGSDFVRVRVRKKIDFHFVNVDLEIESTESLQPLLQELGNEVFNLNRLDEKSATLELSVESRNGMDFYETYDDVKDDIGGVDIHIEEFCNLIEKLSPETRKIWNKCHRKEFDIGFQCGNTSKTFRTAISAKTVQKCAKLEATVTITVYPHHNFDFIKREDLKNLKKKK
jgi:hypothetical protein